MCKYANEPNVSNKGKLSRWHQSSSINNPAPETKCIPFLVVVLFTLMDEASEKHR